MFLRIAGIVDDSVVDGEGIRLTVFTQGCPHHCHGCHNPETWNANGGRQIDIQEIIKQYDENPLLSGITFSGGEPFMQPEPLIALAEEIHKRNGNVWCYTGYTMNELIEAKDAKLQLLDQVDYLVDGPYEEDKRDLTLKFRGSSNQNIWKHDGGKIWERT